MQAFDLMVITWVNQFSNLHLSFDKTVYVVADNHLLKGGVIMGLLWWVWMRNGASFVSPGLHAVRTIGGTLLAILVARGMQNLLPGRLRPMEEPTLNFLMPYGVHPPGIVELSSFPSDHAVMFFALSTALFFCHPDPRCDGLYLDNRGGLPSANLSRLPLSVGHRCRSIGRHSDHDPNDAYSSAIGDPEHADTHSGQTSRIGFRGDIPADVTDVDDV